MLDSRAARYTVTAALVLLLLYICYAIRGTIFIFIVALLFAYLLYPLVDLLNRYLPAGSRTPALAIVYLLLVGVMVTLGIVIGSNAADEAKTLSDRAPALIDRMRQYPLLNGVADYAHQHYGDLVSLLPGISLKVLQASSNLIYLIIVPILSFFILKDGRTMRDELLGLVEPGHPRELLDDILKDVHTLLLQYMRALFTLCSLTLAMFAFVLSVMGVPYAMLFACIAFVLEFIPLVGPLTAAIVIISVSAFSGYPHVLWVVIFLAAYRMVQDYVVSPRLMSAGVELHPMLVILGVFAGGELGGIEGTFLSVPVLALLRVVYRRIRLLRVARPAAGVVRK